MAAHITIIKISIDIRKYVEDFEVYAFWKLRLHLTGRDDPNFL